jgi:hypothetical protein
MLYVRSRVLGFGAAGMPGERREHAMDRKENCWEVLKCGREPGGVNAMTMGVCPAASDASADGFNGGECGGRICWAIGGTFCAGVAQGSSAQKIASCMLCPFFKQVRHEEGKQFLILMPDQRYRTPKERSPKQG